MTQPVGWEALFQGVQGQLILWSFSSLIILGICSLIGSIFSKKK